MLVSHVSLVSQGMFSSSSDETPINRQPGDSRIHTSFWEGPLLPLLLHDVSLSTNTSSDTDVLEAYGMDSLNEFLPPLTSREFAIAFEILTDALISEQQSSINNGSGQTSMVKYPIFFDFFYFRLGTKSASTKSSS